MPRSHFLAAVLAGIVVSTGGCMPFALPTASWTPPVTIPANEQKPAAKGGLFEVQHVELPSSKPVEEPFECHVFRLDVNRQRFWGNMFLGASGDEVSVSLLETAYGNVPAQYLTGVAWGVVGWCGGFAENSTIRVALYRPGYELIVIDAWNPLPNLQWKKATGWGSEALLTLFPDWEADVTACGENASPVVIHLAPGSTSPKHREALLFGAAEYEKLAAAARRRKAARVEQVWQELRARAERLRKLADQ